ncbi:type II and III secretion system protein [Methylocella silvestris BL2]|uniref:Type II and III secretion system protein n=1 Tax=Methylocella silvestris (strain DSM 15510 / CIP 108128 / LMG 27833 / NCIMB 13906 / BL2) TaxID=395965 RepID=B8ERR9_METSB|nr:type II and III secretion system protein family protein [Methylocella silvestris]ACK51617.1 type II and III secretion system protein [Methylocella silvestris BL2]
MLNGPKDVNHAARWQAASTADLRLPRAQITAAFAAAILATAMGLAETQPAKSQAGSTIQYEPAQVRRVAVTRYKSRTFRMETPFSSAVVGSADIADVLPMSDRVIYIQGKRVGTTNVSIFDKDKKLIGVIDLEVTLDIQNIAAKVRSGTDSRGIRVSSNNDQIVLSGEARNAVDADRAVSIAKSMVTTADGKPPDDPGKFVINAMSVAAAQQVLLRVRFVEVNRIAERDIGVNWFGAANKTQTAGVNTGNGIASQVGQSLTPTPGGIPLFQTLATLVPGGLASTGSLPFGVGLIKLAGGNVDLLISALEKKGQARRLAEPDLIALSGDTASFLAGGEYPVPSVQSSSGTTPVITTQYYPYGVQLTFIPTVLANGIINLRLNPSVSELDYKNVVVTAGFAIPSITKREARTTIELRDGQSFAIAGLLQSDSTHDVNQIPWLGSVPVLGALFSSKSYQQNETDLVVIVTPHLVAPAAPGQVVATPFDKTLPANDVDFFVMGRPEVRKQYTDYVTSGGGLTGPYGDIMPLEPR